VTKRSFRKKTKVLLAVVLPFVAVVVIASALFANPVERTEAAQPQAAASAAGGAMTSKAMFQKGLITDLIDGKPSTDTITVKRGQTITVPITMDHLSNTSEEKTVTLSDFHNPLRNFAPSAMQNLSDEEFEELIAHDSFVSGELPVNEYVSFSSPSLAIPSHASAPLIATVSIPEDFPDEMLGKRMTIAVAYELSPESPLVRGIAPSFDIVVVE
jgi:hypothetical protein